MLLYQFLSNIRVYDVQCHCIFNCICIVTYVCMNVLASEGTVRLEDGPSTDRGRVEVFTSGLWRSICVTTWDIVAANLVCAQLGYLRAEEAYLDQGGQFGQGSGAILEDLQCTGSETILQQCAFNVAADGNCSHNMDAAVMCTGELCPYKYTYNIVYYSIRYDYIYICYRHVFWNKILIKWYV